MLNIPFAIYSASYSVENPMITFFLISQRPVRSATRGRLSNETKIPGTLLIFRFVPHWWNTMRFESFTFRTGE